MSDTILLTGISGLIAKRIACDLLKAGFADKGIVRCPSRQDEVRKTLAASGLESQMLAS